MSGVSRGGNSYNNLWDIKKESREIFILYNFLEPDEHSFIDILNNKHKCIDSLERVKNPAGCIMGTSLENVCFNFAYYIKSIESNEKNNPYKFTYKGIDFNFNCMDYSFSNEKFDERCAKKYLLNIYNFISLSDDFFSPLTINNSRMVNFVWSYLRLITNYRKDITLSINHIDTGGKTIPGREPPYLYNHFNLIELPSNIEVKIEQVKRFFGLLNTIKYNKETEIKSIYEKWDNVKNDNRIIDWLNNIESKKNKLSDENKKEMIVWAWRHIKTKYYNEITPVWGGIDNDLSINSIQQQKENIITFFDLMTNEAIKSSIISEFKTSASKAKYKILNNRKIHLNIPVNEDTKEIFDKIKTRLNLSNEELLIKMIHNENERLFKYGAKLDG